MKLFILAFAFLLSACATISGGVQVTDPFIVTDMKNAAFNLDQAVAVGAIPANDPAPACLHSFLKAAGIEGEAPASFKPLVTGVASAASVAYILKRQAENARGLQVSFDCKAMIGQIVLDGAQDAKRLIPLVR